MKEPTVQVPVTVLLTLVRAYSETPQELLHRQHYLSVISLERRAYRKFLEYKKALKEKGK